ncbi:YdbL family protein [Pseudoalteromonas sp. C2R02]|uniref:YdbL family protein n=1 Tax=Pseudoalteromonas sp. C2R02 TaxID=2841565 RepID=UPI001C0857EE|nr:YdbL family protein [Pseudoalteromonas sp. C2R02]MBU2972344.1 YdbL family protein [Pseudoalteromonas sp. C2R02]
MNKLIKYTSFLIIMLSMSFSALALTLQDAKKQGLVGEMPDGYLGAIKNNAQVASLVNSVNKKRKDLYISLARKNKITLGQISALAGEKAIQKTASGNFIKNAKGQWIKKD